ncbi:TetR/AcrR family transcriptional regulator [Blautia sp. HCP3S3_H10_1]|uniref:TetR/AcrR family transcriptional regulator n=1 Tax=unclassified Blautia TaxID=2648079 RepID=UPI003F93EF85|nr:WHG domain-containing protein [Clostridia bacterium]
MFHKGLNKEIIIESAKEMIEKDGIQQFSMRKLAEKLGVKTASLYTHIESMEMLFTQIGLNALNDQKNCLMDAIGEKHGDPAIEAVAEGYRRFAAEHMELYRFIMQMPSGNNEVLKEAAAVTAEPFMKVLDDYCISDSRKMHWQRIIRGLLHGFISEEQSGYFSHFPVPVKESYDIAIGCVIAGLHKEECENSEQ